MALMPMQGMPSPARRRPHPEGGLQAPLLSSWRCPQGRSYLIKGLVPQR